MGYNKDQWIASFEGQISILRPHLTSRPLSALSLAAWHKHGKKDVDPIKAARKESALLDQQRPPKRSN